LKYPTPAQLSQSSAGVWLGGPWAVATRRNETVPRSSERLPWVDGRARPLTAFCEYTNGVPRIQPVRRSEIVGKCDKSLGL